MIQNVIKVVNRRTGKEFLDPDQHLLSYAKADPSTFEVILGDQIIEDEPEVFDADGLRKMSMKSLKEIYDIFNEKLGDRMPAARKNSPTEVISAIMTAQDLSVSIKDTED